MSSSVTSTTSDSTQSPSYLMSSLMSVYAPREQFTMTKGAVVLTAISGIISFICSSMILNVIRMSNQKLTTTYHRIMALMSVFDIIASVFSVLSTLPMPSDDPLKFDGPMLGNKTTCQIQGFLILVGLNGGSTLYLCLSWYFVFKITFRVSTGTISRRIEPLFYLLTFVVAIFLPIYMVFADFIHTSPDYTFCIVAPDHSNCNYTIDEDYFVCDTGEYKELKDVIGFTVIGIGSNLALIVLAMFFIIGTMMKQKRAIKQSLELQEGQSNHRARAELSAANEEKALELSYTRVVVIQAFMIIVAYIAQGGICTLLLILFEFDQGSIDVIQGFRAFLFPLQGFWNLIIFVYDKAYLVHRNDRSMNLWNIIKGVLFYPPQAHEIILSSEFMNATVMNDRMDRADVDELDEEEIVATNIILGREMGGRPKESFDDNSVAFSVQGFQGGNSLPGSVHPAHSGQDSMLDADWSAADSRNDYHS